MNHMSLCRRTIPQRPPCGWTCLKQMFLPINRSGRYSWFYWSFFQSRHHVPFMTIVCETVVFIPNRLWQPLKASSLLVISARIKIDSLITIIGSRDFKKNRLNNDHFTNNIQSWVGEENVNYIESIFNKLTSVSHASVLLLIMNFVKVAVDPRGDSRVDPQTTLTILWRNLLSITGQTH